MAHAAMFEGLVFDEAGNRLEVVWIGDRASYVVVDDDFRRHVDAATVDRQVLSRMKEQIEDHRDIAVPGILQMMGSDDLFTKAAVESSIDKMDEALGTPIPEEARGLLGMIGFRITINFHGDVVEVHMPEQGIDDDEL